MRFSLITTCLTTCLILAASCAGPPGPPQPAGGGAAARPTDFEVVAGTSVRGLPVRMQILGRGPEVVLVLAGIHGDERAGTPLAEALVDHLRRDPGALAGLTVLVMPNANPDGRAAHTRTNARGVDLNRNFPAPNHQQGSRGGAQALSEPEATAIQRIVETYRPVRVLSLHQPLACVDYDGPARALAERIAARCDLPLRKLGTRPGSMGAWLGG